MIDTDDKFPDDITCKKFVILNTYVIKDSNKFYLQLFLQHVLNKRKANHVKKIINVNN